MKNKKLFSILCLTLTASMVLYGCSGTSSSSSTTENSTQEAEAQANTVTAQITKIDGSTVTATVGTLTTAQAPDGNDASNSEAPSGKAPAKPDDSNSSSDSNGAPGGQAPSGEAPAKPDDGNSSSDSNEAPGGQAPSGEATAKPDGDNANGGSSDGSAPSGEAPAKPDGDNANGDSSDNSGAPDGNGAPDQAPDGQAPSDGNDGPGGQMPGGSSFEANDETVTFTVTDDTAITVEFQQGSQEGTLDDLAENQVIEVELDDNNQAVSITVKNLQAGGGFGGSGEVTNGTAAASLEDNASVSGETYTSSGDDENALRADGVTASLNNVTIEKTGGNSSNTEDGDFYGQNAGFLALNGANVTITGATVNTSAINGNGVFSYGEGTTVTISDSTIHTTERNSGGI